MSSSAIPGYEDWPEHARETPAFVAKNATAQRLADVLGLRAKPAPPPVRRGTTTVHEGVAITPLHWQLPYGPPTEAWELRPAQTQGREDDPEPLTGILALHSHGGRRSTGAAQLIDFAGENPSAIGNRLALAGFVVLAHDTFSWASRRFDLAAPPPKLRRTLDAFLALWEAEGHEPTEDEVFDAVSGEHEDLIAKAAGVLGETFAGAVVSDDLVAADVLRGLPGVDAGSIAAIGFSGGGGRAHLLGALDDGIGAVVIAGMMATFDSLVPDYLETHSWLLHSPGLAQVTDWPDIARVGTPRELLVLYGERDPLFPLDGMLAAHHRLSELGAYRGEFFDAGHEFTGPMMDAATRFLAAWRDRAVQVDESEKR
ncbi:dienelactone hydrolase family protein [Rathayibacter sp. KR2-224]|uniref:dienelactone hydrolase family protein n=1 Tax=Rathayibacter sp. KR2-224 TaxID=3400913 RepID=UPI003BFF6BCA